MRVLVTGGLGELGSAAAEELSRAGHNVAVFDRSTRKTRAAARRLRQRVTIHFGDIRDAALVAKVCEGVEAVVHGAAILAPASENNLALTRAVNVGGTRNVVEALEARGASTRLIFLSSVSVYGLRQNERPPRRVDETPIATDAYTSSKIEGESLVKASNLEWTVLRLGVSLRPGLGRASRANLRLVFDIQPDTRVEVVHPDEVAVAIARCLDVPETVGKTLLIGGGPGCRICHHEMLSGMLEAAGLGPVDKRHFGQRAYYTDWLDTDESQALLGYQRRSFAAMREEAFRELAWMRALLWPIRPLVRWFVLSHAPKA